MQSALLPNAAYLFYQPKDLFRLAKFPRIGVTTLPLCPVHVGKPVFLLPPLDHLCRKDYVPDDRHVVIIRLPSRLLFFERPAYLFNTALHLTLTMAVPPVLHDITVTSGLIPTLYLKGHVPMLLTD